MFKKISHLMVMVGISLCGIYPNVATAMDMSRLPSGKASMKVEYIGVLVCKRIGV